MKIPFVLVLTLICVSEVLSFGSKSSTVYYAKPLHTTTSGPPKSKPLVYKVIIRDQNVPKKKIQFFKIVNLPHKADGAGGHHKPSAGESVKIFKIIHVKKQAGGGDTTGSHHTKWS